MLKEITDKFNTTFFLIISLCLKLTSQYTLKFLIHAIIGQLNAIIVSFNCRIA